MLTTGQIHTENFSFTQDQVNEFAQITGDKNPIHLDKDYASRTDFGRPIIHGYLGSSIFSKIIGMDFPGKGTVLLKQTMSFKRPMYVDTPYEACVTVKDTNPQRHFAKVETKITEKDTGHIIMIGEALVMNKEKVIQ